MSDAVKKLLERRANLVTQMREVAERAVDENRDMTADENRQFTECNAEVDALQERADAMLAGEKRAKEIEDSFASLNGKPQERKTNEQGVGAELRAFLRGEGTQRYYDVQPQGPVDYRALSKLTAAAGLNTVPTSFYDRLVAHLIETSGLMQAGPTVLNTASGEQLQIPKTTAHSTSTPAARIRVN